MCMCHAHAIAALNQSTHHAATTYSPARGRVSDEGLARVVGVDVGDGVRVRRQCACGGGKRVERGAAGGDRLLVEFVNVVPN